MPDLAQTRNLIGRLLRDRRANFAVMTALSAPFAIALSAVAVDQGSLFVERRSAQALVDIAAITAATNLDKAEQAVLLTLKDNGIASAAIDSSGAKPDEAKALVSVERGRYSMASALGARFQPGIQPYNAVRVSLRKIGALYFGGQFMAPPVIGTSAVASTSAQAAFSIGSRLLSVDTGNSPILNAVLGGLLGTNLSLGVMDYRALIRADVNILSFFDAMAVRLNMTGVSYDDVLAAKASVGQIARAMADVPGLDGGAKLALQAVAGKATGTAKVPLRQLVDLGDIGRLGVGQRLEGLSLDASAMSLLSAAAALANGTRQVDVNLGASIPGLLSTKLSVAIGEPPQHSPWLTIGEKGKVVRTAQLRLKLLVSLGIGTEPKPPGVKILSVQLPMHVEVARGGAADRHFLPDRPSRKRESLHRRAAGHRHAAYRRQRRERLCRLHPAAVLPGRDHRQCQPETSADQSRPSGHQRLGRRHSRQHGRDPALLLSRRDCRKGDQVGFDARHHPVADDLADR